MEQNNKPMTNRNQRRSIAEQTLAILEAGEYTTPSGKQVSIREAQAFAEQYTRVYSPEASDQILAKWQGGNQAHQTQFKVVPSTTLNAVRELLQAGQEEIFCLNFASAKNPGGGFLGGSQAQEESIARASGLYPCLLNQGAEYYEVNRKTFGGLYTDYMIYSPRVPVFKEESGQNAEEVILTSILTAPAVNAGALRRNEGDQSAEVEAAMRRRIAKVLAIALEQGHRHLVLGAWGCGVFRNDPQDIARYFREVIDGQFTGSFESIVFAVYSREERFIEAFREWFGE